MKYTIFEFKGMSSDIRPLFLTSGSMETLEGFTCGVGGAVESSLGQTLRASGASTITAVMLFTSVAGPIFFISAQDGGAEGIAGTIVSGYDGFPTDMEQTIEF